MGYLHTLYYLQVLKARDDAYKKRMEAKKAHDKERKSKRNNSKTPERPIYKTINGQKVIVYPEDKRYNYGANRAFSGIDEDDLEDEF